MNLVPQDFSIYIYNARVDFRKSIDGLSGIVIEQMGLDLYKKALFVFFNRRRDKVKILFWDRSGFIIIYKRLEEERFYLPKKLSDPVLNIDRTQFEWLFEGYDIWKMKPHRELKYSSVA